MHVIPNDRPPTSAAAIVLRAFTLILPLGAMAACGGGDSGSAQATAPPSPPMVAATPPTPPLVAPEQIGAALRLFESATILASLTASTLYYSTIDYRVWTNGPCAMGGGLLRASLDGGPVASGTILPTGSHTLAVTFADCVVDVLVGTRLSGTASAAYTSVNLSDLSALVSANALRGTGLAFRSDLNDVTSDGSGTWRVVSTGTGATTTYTPSVGSRLINNLTTNTATFMGGSYSSSYTAPPPGYSASAQQSFVNLAVTINGINYVLDGNLQSLYGFGGNRGTHTGDVRITSNQTLMARIYGQGELAVEVLNPLVVF
jgi:hypothetical protein